jgi:Sulfotransferase family
VAAVRPSILYIAGADRSGSTMLGMLLGELPDCVSVGELRHLWKRGVLENRLCGCGVAFSDCPFWSQVGQAAFGGWSGDDAVRQVELLHAVGRQRHFPLVATRTGRAPFRADVQEYADRQGRVYEAVAAVSGRPVIVDSSKSPVYALTVRATGLDMRVLHLIRDSRAVAHSWTRTRAMVDAQDANLYMPTFGPAWSSVTWISNNLAVDAMRAFGFPAVTIRYESLVRNPRWEIARALGGAVSEATEHGLDRLAGPTITVGTQHTVAGNPVRMQAGEITLRLDDAWSSEMRSGTKRTVTLLTWPLLARYGYRVAS